MKIFKIVLISFFALIFLLIVALFIFIKTFDVNRFKPQILAQAKAALGRDIDFKNAALSISLTKGLVLKVNELSIAEDPAFREGDFLKVRDVVLSVDVLRYISKKNVLIPQISVDAPTAIIIRQKDGSLNVLSLGPKAPKKEKKEEEGAQEKIASQAPVLPPLLISSLVLNQGQVTYLDRSFEPELKCEISDVSVKVDNISLTEPFPFVAEGIILSTKKNVKIEGKVFFDMKTGLCTVTELKGATDLSNLLLEKIPVVFPNVKNVGLPTQLKGMAQVKIEKLTAGPAGLSELKGEVSLKDGFAEFKELASLVKDVQLNVKMTQSEIFLENASLHLASGTIDASGTIKDYLKDQNFSISINAENLKIQELLKQGKAPVEIEGDASARMKIAGQGLDPKALSSLTGEGKIFIKKGKLKNINVLKIVLDKISVIPKLSEKIEASLSEKYRQKLAQADTALLDIELPVTIDQGVMVAPEAVFGSDEFLFKGRVEAGFDGAFSCEGSFLIVEEFSSAFVAGVPELKYLLNENGEIYIPLKISGSAGEMNFVVDAEYIGKKLLVNQAKTQLIRVIDKAIGVKGADAQTTAQPSEASSSQASQESRSPAAEIVGSLLGSILK